eukprot:GDKJ01059853.1.p1 GENE.GDKJ01059853.1~~GDKJ01059853.1.p1  ORF type:complete len:227 (-),score=34.23 GDKJ01059853.1:425-1105(-)
MLLRAAGAVLLPTTFFASDYVSQLFEYHKLREYYFTKIKPNESYKSIEHDFYRGVLEKGTAGFDLNMRRATVYAVYGSTLFSVLWMNYFKVLQSVSSSSVPTRLIKTGITTLAIGPMFTFAALTVNKCFREWIKSDMKWTVEAQLNVVEWLKAERWMDRLYEDRYAQAFLHFTNFMLLPPSYNFVGYVLLSNLYNPIASKIRFDPRIALAKDEELKIKVENSTPFN